MERSFFLKKRRADFVAGSLSGRVIVAGGLGKDRASRLRPGAPWTLNVHEQKRVLAPGTLPAYQLIPKRSLPPILDVPPPWVGLRYGLSVLLHGKLRLREHKGHAENHGTQVGRAQVPGALSREGWR